MLHELKQPLNLIRVIAQDVRLDATRDRLEPSALPGSMFEVEQSVDEMVLRLDQLRVFARPPGSVSPTAAACSSDACRAMIERITGAVPRLQMTESFAAELPRATIDPFALEQVLWELADNGVRAAEEAGRDPQLKISTSSVNGDVRITVQDNGGGVSESVRAKIFEPSFTTRERAAGLGLALVLALISEAGGRVALVESSGEGSLFEVVLPHSP